MRGGGGGGVGDGGGGNDKGRLKRSILTCLLKDFCVLN